MKLSLMSWRSLATATLGGLLAPLALTAADPAPAAPARAETPRAEASRADRNAARDRGGLLDAQQRQVFREALQKEDATLRALEVKLQAAQKELMQAAVAENYDEKTVQEKADTVARLQSQMMVLRAKALHTVAPTLTMEQKQQLVTSRFGPAVLNGTFGLMDGGPGQGAVLAPGAGRGQGRGADAQAEPGQGRRGGRN